MTINRKTANQRLLSTIIETLQQPLLDCMGQTYVDNRLPQIQSRNYKSNNKYLSDYLAYWCEYQLGGLKVKDQWDDVITDTIENLNNKINQLDEQSLNQILDNEDLINGVKDNLNKIDNNDVHHRAIKSINELNDKLQHGQQLSERNDDSDDDFEFIDEKQPIPQNTGRGTQLFLHCMNALNTIGRAIKAIAKSPVFHAALTVAGLGLAVGGAFCITSGFGAIAGIPAVVAGLGYAACASGALTAVTGTGALTYDGLHRCGLFSPSNDELEQDPEPVVVTPNGSNSSGE